MENKDAIFILVIIFILGGLAYGPAKEAAKNNTGTQNNNNSSYTLIEAQNTRSADTNQTKSTESPFAGKITLSQILNRNNPDPSYEYIILYTHLNKGEFLDITGWYFKSQVSGYAVSIGKGSLIPYPNTKNDSDIVLQSGDTAYVVKGFSPIGISFRTNKCTGYFEQDRTFVPNILLSCPRPSEEKLPTFSSNLDENEACVKEIENLQYCIVPNSRYLKDLPDTIDSACKNYIATKINYNTCVANHEGEVSFLGNQYYIYLNKFGPLWRTGHDTINLYDKNGLVVDTIEY